MKELSQCCSAPVTVEGNTTKYYVCSKCKKGTDLKYHNWKVTPKEEIIDEFIKARDEQIEAMLAEVIDNIYTFIKLRDELSPKTFIRLSMVMYEDEIWKKQFEAMKVMWDGLVDALGYGIFNERDKYKSDDWNKIILFYFNHKDYIID